MINIRPSIVLDNIIITLSLFSGSNDQLASVASSIVADDPNVLDRSSSVDASPNENGKRLDGFCIYGIR
jgi:hypothetical protein